jgi:hypothetical protein
MKMQRIIAEDRTYMEGGYIEVAYIQHEGFKDWLVRVTGDNDHVVSFECRQYEDHAWQLYRQMIACIKVHVPGVPE